MMSYRNIICVVLAGLFFISFFGGIIYLYWNISGIDKKGDVPESVQEEKLSL